MKNELVNKTLSNIKEKKFFTPKIKRKKPKIEKLEKVFMLSNQGITNKIIDKINEIIEKLNR